MASSPIIDCVYRSITLQTGESYVLPPDAELVLVDGVITSDANCAPTDNLEEIQCYVLYMMADSSHGDATHVYESGSGGSSNNVWISALNVGSRSYSCRIGGGDSGDIFIGQLVDLINSIPEISGIFLNMNTAQAWDTGGRGGMSSLCFKTTPSLAAQISLNYSTSLQIDGTIGSTVKILPIPYADFGPNFTNDKCSCS
jgi:hypothetical protein